MVFDFNICRMIIRRSEAGYIFYCVCVFFLQTRKSKLDNVLLPVHTSKRGKIFANYFQTANYSIEHDMWISSTPCYNTYRMLWQNCPLIFLILTELSFSSSNWDFGRGKISVWQRCHFVDRSILFFEPMTEASFYAKSLDRSVLFPTFLYLLF